MLRIYTARVAPTTLTRTGKSCWIRVGLAGGNDYAGCLGQTNCFHNNDSALLGLCGHSAGTPKRTTDRLKVGAFSINRLAKMADFFDGTLNTLMCVEVTRAHSHECWPEWPVTPAVDLITCVPWSYDGWTKAGASTLFCTNIIFSDQEHSEFSGGFNKKQFETAGSEHPSGTHDCRADSSVILRNEYVDENMYAGFGSPAGGEPVIP